MRGFMKDESGAMYVNMMFEFVFIMSLVYSFVMLFQPFIHKQNVDYMTRRLVRQVELTGRIDANIHALTNELRNELSIDPSVTWTANYISGTNKIQLRNKFMVAVSDTAVITILTPTFSNPVTLQIPINKTASGISEVMWY